MPDTIERTIYKLELDDSGYIKGIESLSASTKKFAETQKAANDTLRTNEQALKNNSDRLAKARKDLEDYTGANARYRKQLEGDVKSAERDQAKLTELVNNNRIAYEKATKAAQDFASTSAKAATLAQPTGKIPIAAPAGIVSPIPNIVSGADGLDEVVKKTIPEFEQLRNVIEDAKTQMAQLNQEDEEFKELSPIVKLGEQALNEYDNAAEAAGGSTQSLRTQLRLGREELVKLEQQGKANTTQYIELEKRVAKLTDEFGDQQARIKILASDTKLLDFGKGAITAATAAFQTYTSVAILVGNENEELQKKTMQLFAAMQLLQSLEQLSNLTRREGVLSTLALSGAQSIYTAVVGASTGALKAFRLALLATGIGAAIAAIGFLVIKYNQLKDAQEKAGREAKLLNTVREKSIEGYAKEVSQLEVLRLKLSSTNAPQNERIRLAKEYNKTADEGNKIDLKQIGNIDLLNAAIDRQIGKIKERALAQAAANVTEEAAAKLFKEEQELTKVNPGFVLNLDQIGQQIKEIQRQYDAAAFNFSLSGKKADQDIVISLGKTGRALKAIKEANDEFTRAAKLTATLPSSTPPKQQTTTTADKKEIENVFEQERAKMRERLAALSREEQETELKIRAEFAQKLAVEQIRIAGLLKDKKLTKGQAGILDKDAFQINQLELDKALKEFRKKITDAREKLNDELRDLENKNIQDRINLIQDEFDRRAALIDFNEKKELAEAKEATDERLKNLNLERLLIGEQAYQDAKARIISAGELQALNIERRFANERQDLAADSFKRILDAYQAAISQADLIRDEGVAKLIRSVSDRFLQGKISYEQFQKELTKIQKDNEAIRRDATLATQRNELRALDDRLAAIKDKSSKEAKELQKTRDELNKQIATGEKDDAIKDAEDKNTDRDIRIQKINSYTQSIGQLADSVISFWQKANEAEERALDRSISLQEKRVSAAQRIAERGNAEYLKQEEDILTQLNIQRENAARKQLAIDAALQASQLLVGITGAIAKIASGIGAAETIAEIAIIVGALATGYGLVKSLQGNQPHLYEGTTYVSRGKNKPGRDTIPAMLNEGEAVIPTNTNKEYHPAIKAIYNGTVPAEHLNNFVKNYHKIKAVPQPDYSRIKQTAELSVSADGKMAVVMSEQNRLIQENNELQRQTLRAMKNMSVSANIDRNGVAIMVNEYMQQMAIDKKT